MMNKLQREIFDSISHSHTKLSHAHFEFDSMFEAMITVEEFGQRKLECLNECNRVKKLEAHPSYNQVQQLAFDCHKRIAAQIKQAAESMAFDSRQSYRVDRLLVEAQCERMTEMEMDQYGPISIS